MTNNVIPFSPKNGDTGEQAQTIGFMEAENGPAINWMNWRGGPNDWHKDTGPYQGDFMIKTSLR